MSKYISNEAINEINISIANLQTYKYIGTNE